MPDTTPERIPGLLEKIAEIFPPLFNWLQARELRKGEERDRDTEERLIEIITTGEHLLNLVKQTFPGDKQSQTFIENEMKIYKEQLKEVQARLRK